MCPHCIAAGIAALTALGTSSAVIALTLRDNLELIKDALFASERDTDAE